VFFFPVCVWRVQKLVCFGDTLNYCKTRTAFLYWRRWWEQPLHHKERKAHRLSSKVHSFSLQMLLACWSCSQFSSTQPYLSPYLLPLSLFKKNLSLILALNKSQQVSTHKKYSSFFYGPFFYIHTHSLSLPLFKHQHQSLFWYLGFIY